MDKDHWVIPNPDSVTIFNPPTLYPIHLTLSGHRYIEAIEIPNNDYVHFKIKGEWKTVYLKID